MGRSERLDEEDEAIAWGLDAFRELTEAEVMVRQHVRRGEAIRGHNAMVLLLILRQVLRALDRVLLVRRGKRAGKPVAPLLEESERDAWSEASRSHEEKQPTKVRGE